MQLLLGVTIQLIHDHGQLSIWVDGALRLLFADIWCIPLAVGARFCTDPPSGLGTDFGTLTTGSTGAANVTLDHVRVYDFALPVDDLGAEALCTEFGDCRLFGVQDWMPAEPLKAIPEYPFVPPSLHFVPGVADSTQLSQSRHSSVSVLLSRGQPLLFKRLTQRTLEGSRSKFNFIRCWDHTPEHSSEM
jgi:hypothetical protein